MKQSKIKVKKESNNNYLLNINIKRKITWLCTASMLINMCNFYLHLWIYFFLSLCKKYPASRSGPLIFIEPQGF